MYNIDYSLIVLDGFVKYIIVVIFIFGYVVDLYLGFFIVVCGLLFAVRVAFGDRILYFFVVYVLFICDFD